MLREGLFDHHRRDPRLMTAAGGTPLASDSLGPVPEGYAWYVENFAYSVVGNNHTALVDVAVTIDGGPLPPQASWDHQGLVWTNPGAAVIRASTNNGVAWYMPPGTFLRAIASGGSLAAGDVVAVTYQIAVHQLNPHFIMSPDDEVQVKAAHERLGAELNMDAVGQRAN